MDHFELSFIYSIGACIMYGYLNTLADITKNKDYQGVKGFLLEIRLCLFWPITLGKMIALTVWQKEGSNGRKAKDPIQSKKGNK